ncbi:hypothetical protein KC19_8G167000 [Ceratodon purpureus]|uniref:Uncharacterized protein n=1 Tax=Ceratodon purpureus TaxID=3225 RepID=A0A8T0H4P9_CERPU|nr:hypothetical protein KC19_8G167000 [Ceratodon purpureus]
MLSPIQQEVRVHGVVLVTSLCCDGVVFGYQCCKLLAHKLQLHKFTDGEGATEVRKHCIRDAWRCQDVGDGSTYDCCMCWHII